MCCWLLFFQPPAATKPQKRPFLPLLGKPEGLSACENYSPLSFVDSSSCAGQDISSFVAPFPRQRPYHVEHTSSRPITEVKQRWAWLVLGWVTAWEHRVLLASLLLNWPLWQKTEVGGSKVVFLRMPVSFALVYDCYCY